MPKEQPNIGNPMIPDRWHGPPTIIHASLMRSGTMSMARAYDVLGFRSYHGLDMNDREYDEAGGWGDWIKMEKIAEKLWPAVREDRKARADGPYKVTREQWDDLFGEFDAITDMGCHFTQQLIDAYPDAKVVLTQRNFDSWWQSYNSQVLNATWHPVNYLMELVVAPLAKFRATPAMKKMIFGSSGTTSLAEFKANGRRYYDEYYAMVREKVPKDRLLEYKLGDGWEPLCKFLDRPVPDQPFPRVNDAEDHHRRNMAIVRLLLYTAWLRILNIVSFGML